MENLALKGIDTTLIKPASRPRDASTDDTDAEREYAYDAHPKSSDKLVEALEAAPKRGRTVVDMKNDWKHVFSSGQVTHCNPALGRGRRGCVHPSGKEAVCDECRFGEKEL